MYFVANQIAHLIALSDLSLTLRIYRHTIYPRLKTSILYILDDGTRTAVTIDRINLDNFHLVINFTNNL